MRETDRVTWWNSIDTESVSDAGSSNVVLAVTVALVVLGSALLVVTAWFWRSTRPDPDALGPLVVMSERRFATLGPIERRRTLDGARPGPSPDDELATAGQVVGVETVIVEMPDDGIEIDDVEDEDTDDVEDGDIEDEDDDVVVEREIEPRPRSIDPLL